MIMRTFKVSGQQALRLVNRARFNNLYSDDLVREYLDKFLDSPEIVESSSPDTLRSFFLTKEQDTRLNELSIKFGVSKGLLFRIAIDKGLGTYIK